MDEFLLRKDSSSRTDDEEPSSSVPKILKKVVKRKYDEDYIINMDSRGVVTKWHQYHSASFAVISYQTSQWYPVN
ncbi:hypothetical protein TNCT_365211 [Trichonephila clavata]|uniref:Uncharacterized protein n=1 Tax=Trichonephila clavata TaxID=2740835 RepID=A0A8X6HYL3_TRICU|nr:hypothetical protein TNCT_365211 [Trichonephila clavata]